MRAARRQRINRHTALMPRIGEYTVQAKQRKPHPRSRKKIPPIGQADSIGVR
jgi:hypothetical protein